MECEKAEVLPVYQHELFEGLVFKTDLLKFVTYQKNELEAKVAERTSEIEKQNEFIETNLLDAIARNTTAGSYNPRPDQHYRQSSLTENNREITGVLEKTAEKLDEVIRNTVSKANSV